MSLTDAYSFAARSPRPHLPVMAARHATLQSPYEASASNIGPIQSAAVVGFAYKAFPKTESSDLEQKTYISVIAQKYPTFIYLSSIVVLTGTVVSGFVGYFIPGPITGVALPIFATLWWMLYRTIRRYDERQPV